VWDELQDSELPPPQSDMAKWESEFNQMMNSEREDMDFDAEIEEQYKNLTREELGIDPPVQFDQDGIPQLGEYVFGKCSSHIVTLHLATFRGK
jgi:peroxin-5